MKNGNPQIENGYTRIANEVMEALISYRIPGEQMQCLLFILRKTYGWSKKNDDISLSQFVDATGIVKQHVCRALKQLKLRNIIVTKNGNGGTINYCFNKKYNTWKALPKKVTLPKKVINVTKKGNLPLPKKGHTKEISTKEKKEKVQDFALPSKDEINDSSSIKLNQDLTQICIELKKEKIFPEAFAFRNQKLNQNKNPRAILHTLSRCYIKRMFGESGPWAYCEKIIQVENGNYNEADHHKTT